MSNEFIPLSSEDLLSDIPTIAQNEAERARKRQAALEQSSKERSGKERHPKERNAAPKNNTPKEAAVKPEPVPAPVKKEAAPAKPAAKAVSEEPSAAQKPAPKSEAASLPVIDLPPIAPLAADPLTINLPPVEQPVSAAPVITLPNETKEAAVKKPEPEQKPEPVAKPEPVKEDAPAVKPAEVKPKAAEPQPKAPQRQLASRHKAEEKPVRPKAAPAPARTQPSQKAAAPAARSSTGTAQRPRKKKQKRSTGAIVFCAIRRTLLAIFTLVMMVLVAVCLILNMWFNGPSPAARDRMTMTLSEPSGTKWVPGLFMNSELVEQIRQGNVHLQAESATPDEMPAIKINTDSSLTANNDEWKDHPDGIRIIDNIKGKTFNAYVMIIRDPSKVYLATSTEKFSRDIPGTRITNQIETEGAIAAINAGAFFDNGTSDSSVGSVPEGLVLSKGKVVWKTGSAPEEGFVGFNKNNELIVADTMTAEEAVELEIRDGCCFGPVLIRNGVENAAVYNSVSGFNPRTAIGQRQDGAVIFVCIDGRQAGSLGGSYSDIIDIMMEYGAVNACNLDGGSSSIMLYRDHQTGDVEMINNYSLLQEQPRKMPTFFMVRPSGEE